MGQILKRIQSIFLGRFNDAEHDGAGFGSTGRVGKQEVSAVNYKRLDTAFGSVVADFQLPVQKIPFMVFPLIQRIMNRFPRAGCYPEIAIGVQVAIKPVQEILRPLRFPVRPIFIKNNRLCIFYAVPVFHIHSAPYYDG